MASAAAARVSGAVLSITNTPRGRSFANTIDDVNPRDSPFFEMHVMRARPFPLVSRRQASPMREL